MSLDRDYLIEQLRTVIDPELNINIVDLGLVYEVEIKEGGVIYVEMTLTTQGCPMRTYMEGGVHDALNEVPGVEEVELNIVFEPPWGPEMINHAALDEMNQG